MDRVHNPLKNDIPEESMLLGGPVQALLCRGLRLGRLGLRETGLGVIGSHLGEGEAGIKILGGV